MINEEVRNRIQDSIRVHDGLLTMMKMLNLRWYCHIARLSCMSKTILQRTVKEQGRKGGRLGTGYSPKAAEDKDGEEVLQHHQWYPNNLQGKGLN